MQLKGLASYRGLLDKRYRGPWTEMAESHNIDLWTCRKLGLLESVRRWSVMLDCVTFTKQALQG